MNSGQLALVVLCVRVAAATVAAMSELSAEREVELAAALMSQLEDADLLLDRGSSSTVIYLAQGAAPQAVALAQRLGLPVVSRSRVSADIGEGRGLSMTARSWRPIDVAVVVAQVVFELDETLASGGRILGVDARGASSWPQFAALAADPTRPLGVHMMSVYTPFSARVLAEFEAGEFGSVPSPSSPVVETFAGLLASALYEDVGESMVWVSRNAAPLLGAFTRLAFDRAALVDSARALEAPRPVRLPAPRPAEPARESALPPAF